MKWKKQNKTRQVAEATVDIKGNSGFRTILIEPLQNVKQGFVLHVICELCLWHRASVAPVPGDANEFVYSVQF